MRWASHTLFATGEAQLPWSDCGQKRKDSRRNARPVVLCELARANFGCAMRVCMAERVTDN